MEIDKHLLQRKWKIFIHYPMYSNYSKDAYHEAYSFDTVEDFWYLFIDMPKPSSIFGNAHRPRLKLSGKHIEGFGMFESGVSPVWEHSPGGHWELGGISDPIILDTVWEILCLMLIGETLCKGLEVLGIRVVDKSKCHTPLYRIEVWTTTTSDTIKSELSENVTSMLSTEDISIASFTSCWKTH